MGRESRVRRLRQRTSSNTVHYATAQELQQQDALLKRAEAAGLVLPEIKLPSNFSLVKLTDE